jgi:FkbM family methyltransferase
MRHQGSHVTLRNAAKTLVERLIGRDIKRVEPNAIVCIDTRRRRDVWFSYDLQLQWLLEINRVDLAIDVGANEGQFAQRLRHVFAGDIVSFEPVSAAFARLAEAARVDRRWSVHQLALGSVQTTAAIHVASRSVFSSFLPANDFSLRRFPRSTVDRTELVAVERLDAVLDRLATVSSERRLFLKLDTQGFDLEVFNGLGRYADQVAVMQSEVSLVNIYDGMPHWTESIDAYERAGLYVAGMFPVARDGNGRIIEYDCLLVRDRAGST